MSIGSILYHDNNRIEIIAIEETKVLVQSLSVDSISPIGYIGAEWEIDLLDLYYAWNVESY